MLKINWLVQLLRQGGLCRRTRFAVVSEPTRLNGAIAIAANRAWQALVDQATGKIKSDVVCDRVIEPEAAQEPAPAHDCQKVG